MPWGKKPSVRYWDSRGGCGCWIDGVQHILAKGPDDAPKTYRAHLHKTHKSGMPGVCCAASWPSPTS